MGHGYWNQDVFFTYNMSKGRTVNKNGTLAANYSAQDLFAAKGLAPALNPKGVIRECCDTEEHPNTVPVILALDVTGSMGSAAAEVAKKLNIIITDLFEQVKDVEFLVMGIGDLDYDRAPIQISQFESDIRIATQLDEIYFEAGGGGNGFESYTAAWYMGLNHTKLDCWKRGKKGLIITLGDEPLNPYLPARSLAQVTGDTVQGDVETKYLYRDVKEYYEVYHLAVDDLHTCYRHYETRIHNTFGKYFDREHLRTVTLDQLAGVITEIVGKHAGNS